MAFVQTKDKIYKVTDGSLEKASNEDVAKYLTRELGYDVQRKRIKKKIEAYDDPASYIDERDEDFKDRMKDVAKLYTITKERYIKAGHSYEYAENKAKEIAETLIVAIQKAINE